jgi:hypothetical protein
MRRSSSVLIAGAACAALAVLAGCAKNNPPEVPEAPPKPPAVACVPAQPGSPMIGTWYSTSRPKGVAGDYRSLKVLSADGRMSYTTQLRFGRRVRPALDEKGCWQVADGVLTIQTTSSHGEDVDPTDPIYTNRYRVEKQNRGELILRSLGDGRKLVERRMPAGYQLPD